jgi:hypothetical protein
MKALNQTLNQEANNLSPLWEIISVITSCLIAEWIVMAFAGSSKVVGAIPVGLALAFMIISHRERGESAHDNGFRIDNFWPAARVLLWPTIIGVLSILMLSWWIRGHEFTLAPLRLRYVSLPLWALFQQYALRVSSIAVRN